MAAIDAGIKAGKMRNFLKMLFNPDPPEAEQRRAEVRQELSGADAIIDGQKYPLQDWSASGYAVAPCDLEPTMGGRIEIEFHVPLPGRKLVFKTPCVTVRLIKSEGLMGGSYLGVDDDSRKIIDEHFAMLTSEEFQQEIESGVRDAAERAAKRKD